MCGRFFLARRAMELARILGLPLARGADRWEPRYNVAPTQDVLAVVAGPKGPCIETRRWGLIPGWAKDPRIGNRMINARIEGIESKPAYGRLLRTSRCLVLADGFYEWKREGSRKVPFVIRPTADDIVGFAGVQARWRPPEGDEVLSCALITRPATGPAAEIHDRMPAILPRESWEAWVRPDLTEPRSILQILEAALAPKLKTARLTTAVNNPRNESPDVLKLA